MLPFRRSGETVDFLSIDTEGHDSLVLLGASRGMKRRAFRVIEFEYHKVGMWARTSLNDTVVALRNHRYSCYWQGHRRLIVFRFDCDNEFHAWSNLVCTHEERVARRFDSLARSQNAVQLEITPNSRAPTSVHSCPPPPSTPVDSLVLVSPALLTPHKYAFVYARVARRKALLPRRASDQRTHLIRSFSPTTTHMPPLHSTPFTLGDRSYIREKVITTYETLFTTNALTPSDWAEFFFLKPNAEWLQAQLSTLTAPQIAHARPATRTLVSRCLDSMEPAADAASRANAMETWRRWC
uniref:Methyltransferase FkbM domain-containing protein n=1 Tax=Coccolithus braarudii TaxID=221442 RepID=A0A7S0L056_9EUKA|mmetsp:Transcript_11683/g.25390  ORF Transcript_11683/g.25390 Transcript_11683/m.25390 type:complete len:296 (+) Transcript_11683:368-1255(+)